MTTPSNSLHEQLWYHGTDVQFSAWQVPPPPKSDMPLQVPHTAVFFSRDKAFAAAAGTRLCATRLSPSARVLDATTPTPELELLRQRVAKNPMAATSPNVSSRQRWEAGWISGECLRFAYTTPAALVPVANVAAQLVKGYGLSREDALQIAQHNTSRGLIELICTEAAGMGFDALHGNEVDKAQHGQRVPKSWLAVFNASALGAIDWA